MTRNKTLALVLMVLLVSMNISGIDLAPISQSNNHDDDNNNNYEKKFEMMQNQIEALKMELQMVKKVFSLDGKSTYIKYLQTLRKHCNHEIALYTFAILQYIGTFFGQQLTQIILQQKTFPTNFACIIPDPLYPFLGTTPAIKKLQLAKDVFRDWPYDRYCLLSDGGSCPNGFYRSHGKVTLTNNDLSGAFYSEGDMGDSKISITRWPNDNPKYIFMDLFACCRQQ